MITLKNIPDQDVEHGLKNLVTKEREILHEVILYIQEVDVRRLYVSKAYSSMYEYLTRELGYSGSAALRRLEAARLLKHVPNLANDIKEGKLNLSQVNEVTRAIKEKERSQTYPVENEIKKSVVSAVVGKTVPETQKELATLLNIEVPQFEKQRVHQDSSVRFEITLTSVQLQKLKNCRDLSAAARHGKHKDSSWATVFEFLADQYLEKKMEMVLSSEVAAALTVNIHFNKPHPKNSVTNNTDANTTPIAQEITTAAVVENNQLQKNKVPKTITPRLRRYILNRDYSCQFRDSKTQRVCGSTYGLEIDHKTSRWAGGGNGQENLQALCRAHNNYKYRKENNMKWK